MKVVKLNVQKQQTHIFVTFSGMHMKKANARVQRRAGKEMILCLRLDEQEKIEHVSVVRRQEFLQFRFQAEQRGEQVQHYTCKWQRSTHGEAVEYVLTDALSILCRNNEGAYEYVLVHKVKQADSGRRKTKRRRQEKVEVVERLLFIVPKQEVKEAAAGSQQAAGLSVFRNAAGRSRKKADFPSTAKASNGSMPIRLPFMRSFGADAWLGTVSRRFLGPGDCVLPQPRAEPMRSNRAVRGDPAFSYKDKTYEIDDSLRTAAAAAVFIVYKKDSR